MSTYLEFMNGGTTGDTSKITGLQQLLAEKTARMEADRIARQEEQYALQNPAQPISQERQLNLAKDFYNNKTQVAGPYSPAFSFVKAQGTVLPSDTPVDARQKAITEINPTQEIEQYRPNVSTSQSTPVTDPNTQGPLAATFGALRATSDIATLPITVPIAALDKKTDVKTLFQTTIDQARKDARSGGNYSIDKAAQSYLQNSGLKDANGNLLRNPNITDVAIVASLGFYNMFGDPVIAAPSLKAVKEFALWKKVGSVDKQLPEGTTITNRITREIPIADDVKIKIEPHKKTITFKGYIRRGSEGEIVNNPLEIEGIAKEASTATGKTITPKVVGNNLVLVAEKKPVLSGLKDILAEKQLRVATVKSAETLVNKPVTKEEKVVSKTKINPEQTFYHGTTAKFDNFDIQKAGENTGWDNAKFGVFFSDDKTVASNFVTDNTPGVKPEDVNIKEVKLNIKKPLDLTLNGILTNKEQAPLIVAMLKGEKLSPTKALALLNEEIDLGTVSELYDGIYGDIKNKTLIQKAGYDGIVSDFGGDKLEYVVLDPKQITVINKPNIVRQEGLNDLAEKKVSRVKAVAQPDLAVKERLAKEKEAYASQFKGGDIRVSDITPVRETAPVEPNFKTASSYEVGEYYKAKEIWDNKNKPSKQVIEVRKGNEAENVYNKYIKLQSSEEISDADMMKAMKLEERYMELTGKDISTHENVDMDNASFDRAIPNEFLEDGALYSGKRKQGVIGQEKIRTLSGFEQEIMDIETGRKSFNIPEQSLALVRKYGLRLAKNVKGSEGHSIGNIIGHDSINNVLLLAHEMTHFFTQRGIELSGMMKNTPIKKELIEVYRKYYPGRAKDLSTVNHQLIYKEGLAEFVRQHLFNPKKMDKKFPNLSTQFLSRGRYSNENVSDLYDELNRIIYIYQNLSTDKQMTALSALNIDFKKEKIISQLIGRAGRIKTEAQYGLYPLHVLDIRANKIQKLDRSKPFVPGTRGLSSEMIASMIRPGQQVALSNLDPKNIDSKILTPEGNVEQFLDFNIGKFIQEIEKNGDTESASNYFRALADRRERIKLNQNKSNFVSLSEELTNTADAKEIKILDRKIKRAKANITRLKGVVESQSHSAEKQDQLIKEGEPKFSKYADKLYRIFDAHLNLMVKDGRVKQETADDWRSIPGYIPGFRMILSDVDESSIVRNEKSSSANELKAKGRSNKALINIFTVIPKLHVETLSKHNAQILSNNVYEQMEPLALVSDLGKGTTNKLGVGVYAKDGKMTQYKIHDPYIAKTMESLYNRQNINNKFLKGLDATMHVSARTFQKFTTQLNYYFAIFKNFFLDSFTSPVLSETGYIPFVSQAKIGVELAMRGEKAKEIKQYNSEYNRLTGGDSGIYELSYDSNNPIDVINKITNKGGKVKKGFKYLGQKYTSALNLTERFTREAEYVRARQQGNSVAQSFEMSRNVSGSWHKTGLTAKNFTKYMPFTNSSIQIGTQLMETIPNKRTRGRVGVMFAIASVISFLGIYNIIKEIDDAQTEEERQIALDKAFRYLDKSSYEKFNYAVLGDKYKMAISPIFSAPGTMVGLLMLSNRIPEYKVNYADSGYQVAQGILPTQISLEFGSGEEFFKSIGGKVVGAFPITNTAAAMSGYKTYPILAPIENQGMLNDEPADRYKADTNNLAILIGQVTGLSPVNIEAAIRAQLGTGGGYSTDALGSLLLPSATKNELGIIHKDLQNLLFTSPTKSAISQSQKTLTGETSSKLYAYGDSLKKSAERIDTRLATIERQYPAGGSTKAPKEIANEYNADVKEWNSLKEEMKLVKKVEATVSVLRKYETMGKAYPVELKNILNRYALSVDSGKGGISQKDLDYIIKMSAEYNDMKNIKWDELQDAK